MARRMTPNQKAWQREMLRIEEMARDVGIKNISSIKPKTPEKITKKHIAQAQSITMDYVREKAKLDTAGIKNLKKGKKGKEKSVGQSKASNDNKNIRRQLTEDEKARRAENLRKGRENRTPEQRSESAKKAARSRSPEAARKAAEKRKAKKEQIANLPKASDLAVDNFFSDIRDRMSAPRSSDDMSAIHTYYNSMLSLLTDISNDRFASLLILADQEGAGIYLTLPPSAVSMGWVMGAITSMYGIVNKYNLGYGKRIRDVWEEMDELYDSYTFGVE